MKHVKLFSILCIGIIGLLSSCKKEETPETYFVKCKIDGVPFDANNINYFSTYSHYFTGEQTGYPQYVTVSVSDTLAPVVGTYTLDPSSSKVIALMDVGFGSGGYATQNSGGSGSIQITEVTSTKVSGSFQGTLPHYSDPTSKTITEGQFNIKRQ